MRKLAPLALLLAAAFVAACTTATTPLPPPPPAPEPAQSAPGAVPAPDTPAQPYGLTTEDEARILALEDRREYDAAFVDAFATHENSLHRQRIALALGRIGPLTFVDTNGNGERDAGERQAGVEQLTKLAHDPVAAVAETAVFALGEIGDASAIETLLGIPNADGRVEAEAVEALSKMAKQVPFARYAQLARGGANEGTRARAVRFLFRFDSDEASAVAAEMLDSTSSAIRQEAAYALARRTYAPAREKLELLTNDPNTLTRAYAISALGRIAVPTSAPLLVTALGDIHPWVRTNAVIAIARLAAKDPSVLRSDDIPRLLAIMDDPDVGVRSTAIDTLGYYATRNQTARQRLIELSKNGSRWERELAAAAIAKHFGDARPSEIPAELTGWGKVRVLETTGAMKTSGAALRRRLFDDPDPMVRAQALGAIPDAEVNAEERTILLGFSEADVVIRANAIERYAKSTAPVEKRLPLLRGAYERALQDRDLNDARLAAIVAIGEIDHPERESFLRSLLNDADPGVRRIAADQIETKLKKPRPQYTPLPASHTAAEYAEIAQWARQPHTATIHMTRGIIEMALLPQDAPVTAWNFAQLAKRGYFDNTTFMRVVPNFVVQGGDPRNDQNGGPGYAIRDEINLQKYTRGAVGMALSGPDTGGSQFFITHSPQPHLDGGYTIFGRVYDGMGGVADFTERGDKVETIKIDEHAAVGQTEIGAVLNVSLPTEVGPMKLDRIVGVVPDYRQLRDDYAVDETVVEIIAERLQPQDRVEVYMGTWCPDSKREVPKFLKIHSLLKEKFGKELPVSYVAVDRSKTKPADLLAGKHVEKIATFIYYRGDAELGRIVETPQGIFEDDLLTIVAKTAAQ
jgi:cyclophilin family peptidyl-prolyl cis-trans isomerase/HEAT repeat protein